MHQSTDPELEEFQAILEKPSHPAGMPNKKHPLILIGLAVATALAIAAWQWQGSQPITREQRAILSGLVGEVNRKTKDSRVRVWSRLKKQIGVRRIDDIQRVDYHTSTGDPARQRKITTKTRSAKTRTRLTSQHPFLPTKKRMLAPPNIRSPKRETDADHPPASVSRIRFSQKETDANHQPSSPTPTKKTTKNQPIPPTTPKKTTLKKMTKQIQKPTKIPSFHAFPIRNPLVTINLRPIDFSLFSCFFLYLSECQNTPLPTKS